MTSLTDFIDNYILILSARFGAPVALERSPYDAGAQDGETEAEWAAWQRVSEALQAELATPRTAQERQQLAHVDVATYSAKVCRGRALHLKQQETLRQREAKQAPASRRCKESAAGGPSMFDITHDSLRDDVAFIYAAVRRCLPTAMLADSSSDDDDNEENRTEETKRPTTETDRAEQTSAGVAVHDVFMPTVEEQERDKALATARDEFLSQVQRLQAAYYEKHRRWVDVPHEVLEAPPCASAPRSSQPAAATKSATDEATERAALLAMLQEGESTKGHVPSAASAVAALRRSIHVDRAAPRPSAAASDEDIEKLYQLDAVPDLGALRGLALPTDTAATAGSGAARAAAQPSTRLQGVASVPKSAPQVPAAASTSAAPARRGRWQIVEYDEAEESEDDSSDN